MNEWIKCSERMPPYNQQVLVMTRYEYFVAWRDYESGEWEVGCCDEQKFLNGVAYWMLLPEPPK